MDTVPMAPPEAVQVLVENSTLAEVQWDPINPQMVRGWLKGYKVQCCEWDALLLEHYRCHITVMLKRV